MGFVMHVRDYRVAWDFYFIAQKKCPHLIDDPEGRFILANVNITNSIVIFRCVCGPNVDNPMFYLSFYLRLSECGIYQLPLLSLWLLQTMLRWSFRNSSEANLPVEKLSI